MASLNVGNLGEYLREQRRNAQLSLRQLADAAGVSNPYLSQIERGLRKPSAEVLQQVAKALRISAETLYVRAGILDAERDRDEVETRAVILADPVAQRAAEAGAAPDLRVLPQGERVRDRVATRSDGEVRRMPADGRSGDSAADADAERVMPAACDAGRTP